MFIDTVETMYVRYFNQGWRIMNIPDPVRFEMMVRKEIAYIFSDVSQGASFVFFPEPAYPTIGAEMGRGSIYVKDPEIAMELADLTPFDYGSIGTPDWTFATPDLFPQLFVHYRRWEDDQQREMSVMPVVFCSAPPGGSEIQTMETVGGKAPTHRIGFHLIKRIIGESFGATKFADHIQFAPLGS